MRSIAVTLLIATLLGAAPAAAAPKELGPDNPVSRFLEDLLVGPGREYRALALFPLTLDGPERPFPSVDLASAVRQDVVALSEQSGNPPGEIRALGFGLDTALALRGEIVEGGLRDRMLRRDAAIGPRLDLRLTAHPVERPSKSREPLKSFRAEGLLAPPYLRRATLRGDLPGMLARLLDHYQPVLPDDATVVSLAAIQRSDRMQFLIQDYLDEFGRFPEEAGGPVVGVIGIVGDRILLWEAFGSPSLLRTHWRKILGSLAFAAAGHEIRTGVAGQPVLALPAEGPERFAAGVSRVREAFAGATIGQQKKKLELEGRYVISANDIVGSAVAGPAGIAHVAVFPNRASDDALYGRRLPAEPEETTEFDPGELLRREREGRLTEFEKRWLERLRRRRGELGGPRPPNPDGGGPPGSGDLPQGPPRPPRVRPGDLPGTEKPEPPKPGSTIRPPGSGGGTGGGGTPGPGKTPPPPVPPKDR